MIDIFSNKFKTTNGLIPFDRITTADYEPAIKKAIIEHDKEIESICNNSEEPTFSNTILALERSGRMLTRVLSVFYPMLSANLDDELMEVSNRTAPLLAEHNNNITLNELLWKRIKYVKESCCTNDIEDNRLIQLTYDSFVRSGAALEGKQRIHYRQLSKQLSELTLKFEQNLLKETNAYEMWLNDDEVDGLPESALEAAAMAAKEHGEKSKYLITLHAPSYMSFMKYSSRRDLREKLYKAYASRCTSGECSNIQVVKDIANTRLAIANLMGFETYAHYSLTKSMAQTPDNVFSMLNQLKDAYKPVQENEINSLQKFANKTEGHEIEIMPWDYSYYSNKEREALYSYNDEQLRPYFELNNVIKGVFGLATRLYGLQFIENHDAQVFHPEINVYNVNDKSGNIIGFLYTDFFPRNTKQSGAWMTNFREQYIDKDGNDVRPIVTLTMNFTRPTESKPSLLTFREVETFMHEFGHGLHSLLSKCKYESTSGTNVYRDFVEMPSQFNENFLHEREFLDSFAKHYITGETIPQDLIDKIHSSSKYGVGYACMRQLGFGYIDMNWYTIHKPFNGDVYEFEKEALKNTQIFKSADQCIMSPQFSHIFSGGYAAGYYGYKWAEVLDADAFSRFKEEGIFNPQTAQSLYENILTRGGTEHPMELYKRFRGREPRIDALLKRDGLKM